MRDSPYNARRSHLLQNSLGHLATMNDELFDDILDIWDLTARHYHYRILENMGLDRSEPSDWFKNMTPLYSLALPAFQISPPPVYLNLDTLNNQNNTPFYSFVTENIRFNTKIDVVNYLVDSMISGNEIFLHSIITCTIISPENFEPNTVWMIRHKNVNWSRVLSRTDFTTKKDFTPLKKLPKFSL